MKQNTTQNSYAYFDYEINAVNGARNIRDGFLNDSIETNSAIVVELGSFWFREGVTYFENILFSPRFDIIKNRFLNPALNKPIKFIFPYRLESRWHWNAAEIVLSKSHDGNWQVSGAKYDPYGGKTNLEEGIVNSVISRIQEKLRAEIPVIVVPNIQRVVIDEFKFSGGQRSGIGCGMYAAFMLHKLKTRNFTTWDQLGDMANGIWSGLAASESEQRRLDYQLVTSFRPDLINKFGTISEVGFVDQRRYLPDGGSSSKKITEEENNLIQNIIAICKTLTDDKIRLITQGGYDSILGNLLNTCDDKKSDKELAEKFDQIATYILVLIDSSGAKEGKFYDDYIREIIIKIEHEKRQSVNDKAGSVKKSSNLEAKAKSDNQFWQDVTKLLNLKDEILKLKKDLPRDEIVKILLKIGKISKSIYRRDKDKSCFRNIYSSNDKHNFLFLDVLERFTYLEDDLIRVHKDLILESIAGIIDNFSRFPLIIDSILLAQDKRIKELAKTRSDEAKEIFGRITTPPTKDDLKTEPDIRNIQNFIAAFYVPKCLDKMLETLEGVGDFNFDDRVDRYYFARIFTILGELSRGIRYVLPPNTKYKNFFRDLNKIRNNLKGLAHIKFISDGVKDDFVKEEKLWDLVSIIPLIKTNIEFLKGDFITANEYFSNLQKLAVEVFEIDLFTQEGTEILNEMAAIFKGKDLYSGKLTEKLKIIQDKELKIELLRGAKFVSVAEYGEFLDAIPTPTPTANFNFPTSEEVEKLLKNGVVNLNKGINAITKALANKRILSKKSGNQLDLSSFDEALKKLKSVRDGASQLQNIAQLEKELQKLKDDYLECYQETPDEYRGEFPANEKDIEDYIQALADDKEIEDENEHRLSKVRLPNRDFIKYCKNFHKEAARMQEIMKVECGGDKKKEKRKQLAINQSVGIIGEAIRYIFEIDEERGLLSIFQNEYFARDIKETQRIRNQQLMHGIFGYNPLEVVTAAKELTIPWIRDARALNVAYEALSILELNEEYLESEAKNKGITKDQLIMTYYLSLGDAYLRLGDFDRAREVLENAKMIATQDKDIVDIKIVEINIMLAAVEKNSGNSAESLALTEEALKYIEPLVLAGSIEAREEKCRLLHNRAMFFYEEADYDEAKLNYTQAIAASAQGPIRFYPAILLARLLYDEVENEEHGEKMAKRKDAMNLLKSVLREELRKAEPVQKVITEDNAYEIFCTYRELWEMQRESYLFEDAAKTRQYYRNTYFKNIGLFKDVLGRGYRSVEAVILRDEAGELGGEGKYLQAISKLYKALDIIQEFGEVKNDDIANLYLNIGNHYKSLSEKFMLDKEQKDEHIEMAKLYYKKAISTTDLENSINAANAYGGLAELTMGHNKKEKDEYLGKALEIFEKHRSFNSKHEKIIMSNLRISANRRNQRSLTGLENYGDGPLHQIQENSVKLSNLLKENNYDNAFLIASAQIQISEQFGVFNSAVAQAWFVKFAYHCRKKEESKARTVYKKIESFLQDGTDVIDKNYFSKANKIFQENFRQSLSRVKAENKPEEAPQATVAVPSTLAVHKGSASAVVGEGGLRY